MNQRKIKTKKYYSGKFISRKDREEMIERLKAKADSIKFFMNMTTDWFIVAGDYYPDSALNPNDPVEDFDDIMSEFGYRQLSSKPQPEKNWLGKWKIIK